MPDYIFAVPADTQTVRAFVNAEREMILKDLGAVRDLVTAAVSKEPVYKIYGRDEKQDGDPIKHRRKIRLKFNDYFAAKGEAQGSLWTVPDIIGFTVVVPYPSDITNICAAIDRLVDGGQLISDSAGSSGSAAASEIIRSRYGRPIVSGGYFACHYNLRLRSLNANRPLCEIQIKTILHDGWGAKTHDLTYKPRGRISEDMIGSFNLLGDTLAKIDQQSDLVRQGIERSSAPREKKKRAVQLATIHEQATHSCTEPGLAAVLTLVEGVGAASSLEEVGVCQDTLYAQFATHPKEVCYLYALLAVRSNRESVRQLTLEALETWQEKLTDIFDVLFSRNVAGLIGYCTNDLTSAIEFGEEAQRLAEGVDRSRLGDSEQLRLARLLNAQ